MRKIHAFLLGLITGFALLATMVVAAPRAEQVKQKAKETWDAATEYTAEQKEKIQDDMEDKMEKVSKKLEILRKDAKKLQGKAKERLEAEIAELEDHYSAMKQRMGRWKQASGEAWSSLRQGMETAFDNLTTSFKEAREKLKQ